MMIFGRIGIKLSTQYFKQKYEANQPVELPDQYQLTGIVTTDTASHDCDQ